MRYKKSKGVLTKSDGQSQGIYDRIRKILEDARGNIARTINTEMVVAYWQIGKAIIEEEQLGKLRSGYGEEVLKKLSSKLTAEFGKGFDQSNLRNIRHFYLTYPKRDALRHELSWTHYRVLMRVDKPEARSFYEIECIHNNWSSRELERQKGSLLFERLALSKDKKGLLKLARKGQEINLTIYNLCRINMFLHDINYNNFDIAHGDTLIDPKHWDDEPFDAIVSNPPYSIRWEGDANPLLINDPRFSPAGVLAPKSKADLAFTMHMLSWLSTSGTAAIVEFPGVLYRGGAEGKIRKYLIDNNYVDAVIQLPPDLFFGTTIATCIIVLKKSKKDNKTLFIDASAEFVRGGNKNKLSETNRLKILQAFSSRKDATYFAKLVDNKAIVANDYNIAVSSYVVGEDTREVVNITELNAKIAKIVARQNELRTAIEKIVADIEGVK